MKNQRKWLTTLLAISMVLMFTSVNASANDHHNKKDVNKDHKVQQQQQQHQHQHQHQQQHQVQTRQHNGQCGNNTVGAPLDGGIFTILLGGAGVAYFTRKKKKNQQ